MMVMRSGGREMLPQRRRPRRWGALGVGLGDGLGAGLESGSAALKAGRHATCRNERNEGDFHRVLADGLWFCHVFCGNQITKKIMPMSKGHE